MPTVCQSYYTVRERLRVLLHGVSKPQLTNLSLMVFGLFAAGHCQLPRIASPRSIRAQSMLLRPKPRWMIGSQVSSLRSAALKGEKKTEQ